MTDTEYNFEIEFVPENPKTEPCVNLDFTGTIAAAEAFAAARHPDYNCEQIIFHRSTK